MGTNADLSRFANGSSSFPIIARSYNRLAQLRRYDPAESLFARALRPGYVAHHRTRDLGPLLCRWNVQRQDWIRLQVASLSLRSCSQCDCADPATALDVNRFVPQANRALRPFNIYLNTRTRSSFSTFTHYLSSFLPPPPPAPHHPSPPPLAVTSAIASSTDDAPISTTQSRRLSSSSTSSFRSNLGKSPPGSPSARPVDAHTASSSPSASASFSSASPRGVPLSPIPPANNPRGELIFSSRVSASFREGYERYRAEWERRRTITLATSVYLATPLRSVTWIRRIVVWRKSESTMTTATVVRVVSSAEEKEGASEKTTQMVGSFPRGEEDRGRDRLRETSSVRVGDERSDAAGGREGNDHG